MAVEVSEEIEQRAHDGRGHGFDKMPREQHRKVSSRGGKVAQRRGTGYRFTSETARAAGRKGGSRPRVPREQLV